MARLAPLALAVLAVFALATVASSLDSVSTEPTIESDTTPTKTVNDSGGAGPGGQESGGEDNQTADALTTPAPESGPASGPPLWQVAVGLGLVLVGSAVALYGLTRGDDGEGTGDESPAPEPTAPPPDSVTLGADVPASNDVYRAWNALCVAVPLDHDGRTPAEVAEAAIAAGHRSEPVAELTEAFCAVRYGGAAPTGEREQRARALASTLDLELEGEP